MRRTATLLATLACLAATQTDAACRVIIEPVAKPLNACLGTDTLRIAAVGDVLLHRPLQRRGYGDSFRGIWAAAEPFFKAADIAYANLEGPVAMGITKGFNTVADPGPIFDDRVYSSFPMFNYHPVVIDMLKASGIDIVSTANNHAVDRGTTGIDLTIDALDAAAMPFTGTIRTGAPRDFVTLTPTRMGNIAWIACTFSTNGIPDPNAQVLMCYGDRQELLALIGDQSRRRDIAAVIVTPHWGDEYSQSANTNQRDLAADMVQAGATAVIGTHPHVIQPWDTPTAPDGSRSLVIYSTGNFVSGQVTLPRRTGALAMIELCRPPPPRDLVAALKSGLVVARTGWVPLVMTRSVHGPELEIGGAQATGIAADGRALATRLLPDPSLRVDIDCTLPDDPLGLIIALQ